VISSASIRDTAKEARTVSDLKHYKDAAGHVFSMTEADAKMLGYTPVDFAEVKAEQAAADEVEQEKKAAQPKKAEGRGR
jgi:hypothetical protein